MLQLGKHARSLQLILSSLSVLLFFFIFFHPASRTILHPFRGPQQKTLGLHFLVPTTSTNVDVCQLIFSASALGYPAPSLLGWEGRGKFNGTENHLFKLSETLFYLNTLRKDRDDDLVLLLDAFDVWIQLPPELLIQRYYKAIEKDNRRLHREGILDKTAEDGDVIRNRILFGADKFCWPPSDDRPCDSGPSSPLPDHIFGPHPESEETKIRPRYLNSGTIIGPVRDVRNLFRASLDAVDARWDDDYMHKTSDQHYLDMLWEEQEAARMRVRNGTSQKLEEGEPPLEFHIALDYESDAFQVNNFYSPYVTWMTYNRSAALNATTEKHARRSHTKTVSHSYHPGRLDRLKLADDIISLPGPYSAATQNNDMGLPTTSTWRDVMLGTNTATGEVFPVYHITGDKLLRGEWWPRFWFHPHGEALLHAARAAWLTRLEAGQEHVLGHIGGVKYVAAESSSGDVFQGMKARDKDNMKGGAWNDLGEYMRWDELCGEEERLIFVDAYK